MAKGLKEKERLKVYKRVFDSFTIDTLWKLIRKGEIDGLEHIISTGKEADVYRALLDGKPRACKIYRYETTGFKNMWEYLEGDERFTNLRKSKRQIIATWCRKEFKNLQTARSGGCNVPKSFTALNNVLIMEFLGKEEPAPMLKEVELPDYEGAFWEIVENVRKLYKAGIVHADVSEYNILYWKRKFWLIDMAQGVPLSHPKAMEFLQRDVSNLVRYFKKKGVKADEKQIFKHIIS